MPHVHVALILSVLLFTAEASEPMMERRVENVDGHLRTTSITNAVAGRTLRVAGPEFVLTHGDGESTTSDAFSVTSLESTPKGQRARLESSALGLRALIDYEGEAGSAVLRKRITFTNTGANPFLLRTVELEHLRIVDEPVLYAANPAFSQIGDWGQPVFTESLWFGVEFPATRSSAMADGTIFLRQHPGIELAPGESYTTKTSVIGAAAAGQVQDAFHDYIAGLCPVPDPPRANIYWNGFRVIKPPNRTPQGLAMIEYAKKLKDLTGFTFDGWTYDAGFDMYRPDALFVPNEPDIWRETRAALKPIDTPLGMWTSFSCIFDTPTHAWGKTQGYELQHDASYCLAGPVYYAAIKKRLEDLVAEYGMNTINFDGMYWGQGFGCNQPGHGHLVGEGTEAGAYATERVVENKLKIFQSLREINPKIVLDLFVCNEWASPWWLMTLDGVHTVAGDTLGCDIPSPWLRDELITVRDIQVWQEHRGLERQFPLWAEDLYGTQVRADHLIDGVEVTGEDMAARWEDEFVLALVGRGAVANHIICSDLGVLDRSPGGLRFLGEAGNWVRANSDIYRDWKLIGGEPAKRQPYGYAHSDGEGRSLVALRNPWIEPRTFALSVDEALGTHADEAVYVNVVYPYRHTFAAAKSGGVVEVLLADYEVMLLEVRTASRQLANVEENTDWTVDEDGHLRTLHPPEKMDAPSGTLFADAEAGVLRIHGQVSVPAFSQTCQLQLMLLPENAPFEPMHILVDGAPREGQWHRRNRAQGKTDAWLLLPLLPEDREIDVALRGSGPIEFGAWCVANFALNAGSPAAVEAPDNLFPVFADMDRRRIGSLLAPQKIVMPLPPLPDGQAVNLSEFRNRCLSAKVGFFSVGWDTSCWPADRTLRIGDATYERGIGVHSPSELTFQIDGAFATFEALAGMHTIDPAKKADPNVLGSAQFIVEGDGKVLFSSDVLREGDTALAISVPVAGVRELILRTTDGGDNPWDDLCTWAEPRVIR